MANISVRARLAILMFLFAIPVTAVFAWQVLMHRSVLVEQAHEKALATARHGASIQGEIIVTARAILTSLANIPETMSGSGRACHEPFRLIVANTPWLENLWLTSPNGKVLCSSLPADTVFSGGSLAYVSEALKTEMFATSELVTSPVAGKPTILTVMPRFGPQGVESALVASMDLNWLNRLARQTGNEAQASVFVLDRANTIVAAYLTRDNGSATRSKSEPYSTSPPSERKD